MEASASTRTSPTRVAVGAIHAPGLTSGSRPSKAIVAPAYDAPSGYACGWEMLTSQGTPNWSTHMPNSSPQDCFCSGMVVVPPADSFAQ